MLRFAEIPSVRPFPQFDANHDAQALKNAMKGKGCDEKEVMNILCKRSNAQRQKIKAAYKTAFGEDLTKELTKELKGNSEELILALLQPLDEYDASEIHKAIKGLGTDEAVLIEILTTRTNSEVRAIKDAYKRLYGAELEKDLIGDTSGEFQTLLSTICEANKDETKDVDELDAFSRANQLNDAVNRPNKKFNTAHQILFDMLDSNTVYLSHNDLRRIFYIYRMISGRDVEDIVEKEFSGDARNCLLALVSVAKCRPGYFANIINQAIKDKKDKTLIRNVVSRSEKDLKTISQEYQRQYANHIVQQDDSKSNTYKEALAMLINGSY